MSNEPTATPPPAASDKPAKPKKPRRTWRQRLKLAALAVLILACVFRIALNVLLPTVIRKVASGFGMDCAYARLDLSLLGGTAHIWDLSLRPKAGGQAIVEADYLQGNISPFNLLRGRLVVYRAEVDGVDVVIDREADGSIPILKSLAAAQSQATPPPVAAKAGPAKPFNLQSPLRVDALRVSHVKTIFRDRSVTPPFEATIRTSVRVSDVGADGRPARFELEVGMDPLLDTLLVQGEAHNTADSLNADVQVLLRGVHPQAAAGYLAPLGLKPVANDITVRASLKLDAKTIANTPDVSANLLLTQMSAVVDGQPFASLEKITLDAKRLNATAAEFGKLVIENGRLVAGRNIQGVIEVAGIELAPASAAGGAPTTAPVAVATATTPTTSVLPFAVSLDELSLKDLQASFQDAAVAPATTLIGRLDDMSVKGLTTNAAKADTPLPIAGTFALPGVVRAIHVDGSAAPLAATKRIELNIRGEGVKPDALRPYLAAAGVESQLQDASFAAKVSSAATLDAAGDVSAELTASEIHFDDGSTPLIGFDSAKIAGLSINAAGDAIGVGTIEFTGPTLELRRDHEGRIGAAGFRIVPIMNTSTARTRSPASVPTTSPGAPSTPLNLPSLAIGRLRWSGVHIALRDDSASPPVSLAIGDAGVELDDLLIDLKTTAASKPGRLRAWLSAPRMAEKLAADGTFTAGRNAFDAELAATGRGMNVDALATYLAPLGIVPTLKAGAFDAKVKANLASDQAGIAASLDLADVRYADGDVELAGVDRVRVGGLRFAGDDLSVQEIGVVRPRLKVARHADGSLEAGGVRLVASPTTAPIVTAAAPGDGNWPEIHLAPLPITLSMKSFRVEGGSIAWTDRAVMPAVETTATASVTLTDAAIGADAKPAALSVEAKVNGVIDHATIEGGLTLSPEAPAAKLNVNVDGMRTGPLAAYLPAEMSSTLKDGRFAATVDVGAVNHPDGGIGAHFAVSTLVFEDRGYNRQWAKVDAFKLNASRIDPAGGVIAIDELSSSGVAAEVRKIDDGAIEAMGVRLGGATSGSTSSTASTATPTTRESLAVATSQPVIDAATMVANARRPLVLVTIGKLDLGLEKFSASGFTGPNAAPISLAGVRLRNVEPIAIGGAEAEARPPVKLQIDGKLDPVVSKFGIAIEASPMANEPAVAVDVSAAGIRGEGLTELLPALKSTIDGSQLTAGTFRTRATASINYGRRGARDFDLSRGFTAMFDVKPIEFRAAADGPIVAGLEELRGDGIKVEPMTGSLFVKSLEVSKPIGRFTREADGVHAFGLVLPLATASPAEPLPPTTEVATTVPEPVVETPAQRPANELRLDRLTVSGIDVAIEDKTTAPVTLIPLTGLDIEISDVSNQMAWTGKPVRFNVLCTSGKVPLPARKGASGDPTTRGADSEAYLESRELFSQVTANGRIGIKQTGNSATLDGWAKTSVNGFELLGLRGLAKQYGVTIGGGAFDDRNDFRFRPDGLVETSNKIVFTNLSLSEPADGPLRRIFKLPAPIDVAIDAITDPDGSITMNLPIPLKNGAVNTSEVIGPALGAVANVLITGIASAPVKAIQGIGALAGLGGKKDAKPERATVVQFLPGYAELDTIDATLLSSLAQRLRKDKNLELQLRHVLSADDVARAGVRANPLPADCAMLAERLRARKAELLVRRGELVARARGEIGAQSAAGSEESLGQLRDVERQLARAEASLDELYDLLRPGAESQADRRTRAASLDLGRQRLEAVRAALVQAGGKGADAKVHVTNAQFDPSADAGGGKVTVSLVAKKK